VGDTREKDGVTKTAATAARGTEVHPDRNTRVGDLMWLVRCIAGEIAGSLPASVETEDLISSGMMGLVNAVDSFDPSKGASLETYARYRIKGAILDELRRQDVLPHSTRSRLRQLERAVDQLERTLGRYPTDEEIAEQAGIEPQEIPRLLSVARSAELYSLDEIFETGCEGPGMGIDPGGSGADPLSRLERKELESVMVECIRELPRTEKLVLSLYYYEGLKMKEIGEALGISESRVSQVHSKAIMVLKSKLRIHILG
jgi:RNA polymerase sigma factor for flagellar operon FliA